MFLGHKVTCKGVSPDPEKVAAVQSWDTPETVRQVVVLVGVCGLLPMFY